MPTFKETAPLLVRMRNDRGFNPDSEKTHNVQIFYDLYRPIDLSQKLFSVTLMLYCAVGC